MKRLLLLVSTILLTSLNVWASHIKAGEIIIRRESSSGRYFFDLIVYFDSDNSVVGSDGQKIDVSTLKFNFGDNNEEVVNISGPLQRLGNNVSKGVYKTSHTYSASSGKYLVSFSDNYRISGILNLGELINGNLQSGNVPLCVYAEINLRQINNTPILTASPIDIANQGELYTHNPGAYDPDGDSLKFELIPPRSYPDRNVPNYTSPADPRFGGKDVTGTIPATMTIDPKTGQITWNSPGEIGFYNIAIKITEYKSGVEMGYVIRDMQIEVKEPRNKPPMVISIDNVCLEANRTTEVDFRVEDPNLGERIKITKYGYDNTTNSPDNPKIIFPPADATEIITSAIPYTGKISWTPSCAQVREQPYNVLIKAEDRIINNTPSSLSLSNIKTISMRVRGPKPVFKSAEETPAHTVKLSWEPYRCVTSTDNRVESLKIYRAECDSNLVFDPCSDNKAVSSNYQLIATVKPDLTEFTDNNNGLPFKSAVKYYYTMIAYFKISARGVSYAAVPISITFNSKNALITTVDVEDQKRIKLTWLNPDLSGHTPNYGYEIMRSTDNINFTSVLKVPDLATLSDEVYLDNNVDLALNNYYYQVRHFANGNYLTPVATSATASNIILSYKPLAAAVQLNWAGTLPYNVYKVKIFDIKANKYIDSVSNTSSYTIKGLQSCVKYDYRITTYQRYCVTNGTTFYTAKSYKITVEPLQTNIPKFNITLRQSSCYNEPCEVALVDVSDTLRWPDRRLDVCSDLAGYNVYFKSATGGDFTKIASLPIEQNFYISYRDITRVGCYIVKLVEKDNSGQNTEKSASEPICVNNDCYCFRLPNIITPNGDNLNDLLLPLRYPRYIKGIKCMIYNRWGTKVYETTDPDIKWEAKNVEAGIYYYEVELSKYSLDGHDKEEIKGYVKVVK